MSAHATDSPETDADLLAQARNGDERAFQSLYERHRDPVFRFAYRLLGSQAAAEDVAHDCFLGVVAQRQPFEPQRASLRTYLCGAARNLAFQHLRRQGVQVDLEDAPVGALTATTEGPLDRLLGDEHAAEIARAVGRLPPLQREALVLFEYEEMTLADIAEVSGANVPTISARLSRARERLRSWLSEVATPSVTERRRR